MSLIKGLIACYDRLDGNGCRPVLLCLDEIGRTPIPDLDGFVSTVRSRNIFIQLYAQSFAQLQKNYGEKEAEIISANMDTHIIFRPNDQNSAADIEAWLGRGSQFAESYSMRQGDEVFSENLSEQAIPVMSARELQEMHAKYAIIFHRDYPPIKAYRLKWWQSPILKKRQGLPPPTLPPLPQIPDLPTSPEGMKRSIITSGFINPYHLLNRSEERLGTQQHAYIAPDEVRSALSVSEALPRL